MAATGITWEPSYLLLQNLDYFLGASNMDRDTLLCQQVTLLLEFNRRPPIFDHILHHASVLKKRSNVLFGEKGSKAPERTSGVLSTF
jgi:hypothetical protein